MRRFLLIFATAVIIVLGAVGYVLLQAPPPKASSTLQLPTTRAAAPPPVSGTNPTTDQSMPIVQTGDDVWITVHNETGGVKWMFRAAQHTPNPDNTVDVVRPEAKFFLTNGQVVLLQGATGRVIMPDTTAKNSDFHSMMLAPPSRGMLHDVTISMFDATDLNTPTLVAKMNNVSFDNDTYLIATEAFTKPDGTVVPADQVPVQVRGKAYDFDGRGLTVQWNDRDRRLEHLEIAHGEELTIKNAGNSPTTAPAAPNVVAAAPTTASSPRLSSPAPAPSRENASRGAVAQAPAAPLPPTSAPTTQKAEPPTYRATFYDGVVVQQKDENDVDQTVATAQTMQVDFKNEQDEPSAAPQPQTPQQQRRPAPAPARRGRRGRGQAPPPPPVRQPIARAPASAPTTQRQNTLARGMFPGSADSSANPYVIHWPGKLIVVPNEDKDIKLQPGQQIVQMFSGNDPVVLHYASHDVQNEVKCASFLYNQATDGIILRSSDKFPIVQMKDSTGKMLNTPSLVYSGDTHQAVMTGASQAEFPVENDQGTSTGVMKTQWSKSCVMLMAGETSDQLTLQQADIEGDVKIDHPSFRLESGKVHAEFAPSDDPTQKQSVQPKLLLAIDDVKCDMIQTTDAQPPPGQQPQQQKVQHITSDRLQLLTRLGPDGKTVPDKMIAEGNVHTYDDAKEQDLHSGALEATIAPTTQSSDPIRVQHLYAHDNVVFAAKDSSGRMSSGTAEQLDADTANGDQNNVTLNLTGTNPLATITSDQSTLHAGLITIHRNELANQQSLHVTGPGTIVGVQQKSPNEKPTPYQITWKNELTFDGGANHGEADGDVVVNTTTSDDSKDTMTGQHLTIELADAPSEQTSTTAPATHPSAQAGSTGSPQAGDAMNKKVLKSMTLTDDEQKCEIRSILNAPNGDLLRQIYLWASKVQMESAGEKDWRLIVPVAGQILLDDHRPTTRPTTQSSTQPSDGALPQASLGDMSGATAFDWQQHLIYDQLANSAEFLGNVRIVHQNTNSTSPPFTVQANRIIADFENDATAKATTKPTTNASDSQKIKLKHMLASEQAWFKADMIEFAARQFTFDPDADTIVATGDQDVPVQVYGKDSTVSGSWKQAIWNTRTQKVILKEGQTFVPR